MQTPKVKHGPYVTDPRCEICNDAVPHEWLDGDYSAIVCEKKKCLDEYARRSHIEFKKMYNIEEGLPFEPGKELIPTEQGAINDYKIDKNEFHFIIAETASSADLEVISDILKEKGLNFCVANFDLKIRELSRQQLKELKLIIDQALAEEKSTNIEAPPNRYDILIGP